jgi:hypothetical protein
VYIYIYIYAAPSDWKIYFPRDPSPLSFNPFALVRAPARAQSSQKRSCAFRDAAGKEGEGGSEWTDGRTDGRTDGHEGKSKDGEARGRKGKDREKRAERKRTRGEGRGKKRERGDP